MACKNCDETGWVCEEHTDKPWGGMSVRADACNCGGAGQPCRCARPEYLAGYKQAQADAEKIIEEKMVHYDGGYAGVLEDVRGRICLLPATE